MRRFVRFCLAAAALCAASPAFASDFSGFGRLIIWGFAAFAMLLAIPTILLMRKGRPLGPEVSFLLAAIAAVMLAPAVAYRTDAEWIITLFPGAGIAMTDGNWGELFPVPLLSIALCTYAFYRLFRRGARADEDEGSAL